MAMGTSGKRYLAVVQICQGSGRTHWNDRRGFDWFSVTGPRPLSHQSSTSVANPRKMKNPMESVMNVVSTAEPKAGSRPLRSITAGAR